MTEPYVLDIDMKQPTYVNEPVVKQRDDVTIVVNLLDNGLPYDFTDSTTLTLTVARLDKVSVTVGGTQTNDNQITFKVPRSAVSIVGRAEATIQIYGSDGRSSSTTFFMSVHRDPSNQLVGEGEKTLIEVVLSEGPAIIADAQTAATNAQQVADDNQTRFLEAVSTVALRDSTYPEPKHGDTVRVTSEAKTYRYEKDIGWVVTDVYNPTAIDAVSSQLNGKASVQEVDSLTQRLADTVTQVNGVKPVGGVIELPMPEIDTSELATKVELQAIASGSPKGTYDTVLELESAHPMGNDNIYIITTGEKSGHWYYWDVTWKDGGLYQSAGIAENAVSPKETTFLKPDKRNLFNPDTVTDGYRLGVNGELLAQATSTISDFFPVIIGKEYIIVTGTTGGDVTGRVIQYDTSKVFASVISTGLTSKNTFMATADGFVRVPVPLSNKYTTQITEVANYGGVFVPFGYTADKNIKISTIDNDIIVANNLKKDFRYRGLISIPNLNTLLNDGTYLITGGGENRPAEVTDSTSYLEVTRVGDTVIQDFMQYTALKQRKIFRRFIRANVNDFGAWFLLNRDEDQGANYLENKKIVLMGDSITGGSGYYLQLIKRLRANVINCGFGGTRMTYHTDPNFDKFSFTKLVDAKIANNFTEQDIAAGNIQVTNMPANLANLKATDFSTVDYLTIWFGTNDFSGDIYLGEDGSEDTTTLKGALQYGIRRLLEAYPQLKIIVITPMFRTVGSGNSDDTTNTYRQLYLNDYVKAIEEVANNNHVPCLNMYKESGINKFNHTRYLSDGLHPYLEKGYVHVGNKISSFISSNF